MERSTLHIRFSRLAGQMEQHHFNALAAEMPEIIQTELNAYKRWQDAQASLAGKLLLRDTLQELGLPYSVQAIRFLHKDRPHIDDTFDFNISHSGDYIVLVLSEANRVGIDIEKHRPLDTTLFRKYFSADEWEGIQGAKIPSTEFFRLWSVKEAAIKCDGRGVEVLGKTHTLDDRRVQCDEAVLSYREISIAENYACAVCSARDIGEMHMKETPVFSIG